MALTATGKRKYRQLWSAGKSIRARMVDGLSAGETELLLGLLRRIAQGLNVDCEVVS